KSGSATTPCRSSRRRAEWSGAVDLILAPSDHCGLPTSCHLLKNPEYRRPGRKSIILFEITAFHPRAKKEKNVPPHPPSRPWLESRPKVFSPRRVETRVIHPESAGYFCAETASCI